MTTPEQALIAQAGPHVLSEMTKSVMAAEITKGCSSQIFQDCVALEPAFEPINVPPGFNSRTPNPDFAYEPLPTADELVRYQVRISPEQTFNWVRCEQFLKQLLSVNHRVGLEIKGNCEEIVISLLCHQRDAHMVSTSFDSKLEKCLLAPFQKHFLSKYDLDSWSNIRFYDFFPTPPYSHLLTRPDELKVSAYECLFACLAKIPPSAIGMYQVMFQPVSPEHNWHRNIKILVDMEHTATLVGNRGMVRGHPQQIPSNALTQMATEVESKAHNDKPFFAAAVRVAAVGDSDVQQYAESLALVGNLFQHGGRPLNYLTEYDYKQVFAIEHIRRMLMLGLTYRPGFLVNSEELAGLVHVPSSKIVEHLDRSFKLLDPITLADDALLAGTMIGTCTVAGVKRRVCIPEKIRLRQTHLVGSPGTGKSMLENNMALNDIKNGYGVAVLDPHGDLVESLLYQIPEHAMDRVIYFDPGDPNWVPLWNPLQKVPDQDIGRMADDLIGVLKSFVTGWGDRMENILRHSFFALMHLSGTTFLDVSDMLRKKTPRSERIRKLMLEIIDNETARMFWQYDFDNYKNDELGPPKHKLSKLLVSGTVSLMLSQPYSAFNFRHIMDKGMIFLANLSNLGSEVRNTIGGFMLSTMYTTALGRSIIPVDKRRVFHIYLDEAPRFVTDSLPDIIAETRKYGISLTLAHQYLRQFSQSKIDALSSVATTIVFNVDSKDAGYLCKNFRKKVSAEDIIELGVGEAMVRCGTEIVRIKTPPPLKIPKKHFRDEIIARSRELYCRPVHEVRKIIRNRGERFNKPFSPLTPAPSGPNTKILEPVLNEF
jgi:hypothetical protein